MLGSYAVVLRRYEQYQDALANDRAFQRRYMVEVPITDAPSVAVRLVTLGVEPRRSASRSATFAPNDHPQTIVGPSASSRTRPIAARTSLVSA